MPFEHTSEALRDAAQEVLEFMFFIASEETPVPPEWKDKTIRAQVEFQGQWAGRCAVEMPETFARTMAGNFTGILDPDQVQVDIMIETLCEFANMICGSTITRMACPGIVTLGPPHLIEEWPRPKRDAHAAERWLDADEGAVHIRFEAEAKV